MASIITRRILVKNEFLKCYYLRNISMCEKNFCSKDPSNTDPPDKQSSEINLDKNEKQSSPGKSSVSSEKSELPDEPTKEAAKKKLFSLLSELKITPDQPKVKPNLVLAKPLKRITKKERLEQLKKDIKSPDEEIKMAVNAVAETVGGDIKETEVELKQKLSSLNLIEDVSEQSDKYKAHDLNLRIDETLQENLISSVKDVASTVTTPIRSKLTERLLRIAVEKQGEKKSKMSIEDMVKGMKFQKRKDVERKETFEETKKERKIATRPKVKSDVNIFLSDPLDIFSVNNFSEIESKETMWQKLEEKRLKLLSEFAPSNAFEEMIMWTEQGKHWKFPINNEIDMGEEENVGFHEHVFLDQHLQGFPTRGPIRHFMELVIVGLSKNPYITVERKIENIEWFRQYFKEKEDILRDCGVLEEAKMKAS